MDPSKVIFNDTSLNDVFFYKKKTKQVTFLKKID